MATLLSSAASGKTAKLVEFGRGGDSVEYGGGCSGSGYGTPENPHAAQPDNDCIIPDGTPAIDKRAAIDTPEGYSWVFKGPMVDVNLPEGGREDCPQPSALFASAVAGNDYGKLLALQVVHRHKADTPGPLDYVCLSEYVEGWRNHGARIGHYRDDQIVWDD